MMKHIKVSAFKDPTVVIDNCTFELNHGPNNVQGGAVYIYGDEKGHDLENVN